MSTLLLISFILYVVFIFVNLITFFISLSLSKYEPPIIIALLSFIPIINIGVFISWFIINRNETNSFNKMSLEEINEFKECSECNMIIRKGYIVNETCPICEKSGWFNNVYGTYSNKLQYNCLSDSIPEQQLFSSIEEYENYLIDLSLLERNKKIKEQELIYETIQSKKISQ